MEETNGDTAYIHSPDELEDDDTHGLVCFLSHERPCGADCMAFITQPSESPALNEQQKCCIALVSLERLGRYSGGLLKMVNNFIADVERGTPSPKDPKGGS